MKNWKKVYETAKEYDLYELSLTTNGETITVRRGVEARKEPVLPIEPETHFKRIVSPLSGIFYRSPSPGADPFVSEGEKVGFGDALCIIEAMKVLNEITSEAAGTIYKIVPNNGEPVGEGDLLFLIEPEASSR